MSRGTSGVKGPRQIPTKSPHERRSIYQFLQLLVSRYPVQVDLFPGATLIYGFAVLRDGAAGVVLFPLIAPGEKAHATHLRPMPCNSARKFAKSVCNT
jgi:hypothetical protein